MYCAQCTQVLTSSGPPCWKRAPEGTEKKYHNTVLPRLLRGLRPAFAHHPLLARRSHTFHGQRPLPVCGAGPEGHGHTGSACQEQGRSGTGPVGGCSARPVTHTACGPCPDSLCPTGAPKVHTHRRTEQGASTQPDVHSKRRLCSWVTSETERREGVRGSVAWAVRLPGTPAFPSPPAPRWCTCPE